LDDVAGGRRLESSEALGLAAFDDLPALTAAASALRDAGHQALVSFSRKVFIPLTQLCRDVCHYCTFAQRPDTKRPAYLSQEQVLAIARAGLAAGCREALFTLGDKPELRYRSAQQDLARLGYGSTLAYLAATCRSVFEQTGLLPHVNPGTMSADEIAMLRGVCVS
jgi:FO synthase